MSKDDGGSAFPQPHTKAEPSDGMSLRDYFAAAALSMVVMSEKLEATDRAEIAYAVADAMLEERKK